MRYKNNCSILYVSTNSDADYECMRSLLKNMEHNISVVIIAVRLWIFSIENVLPLKITLVLFVKLDLLVVSVL